MPERYLRIIFDGGTFYYYRTDGRGEEYTVPEWRTNLIAEDIDEDGQVLGEWDENWTASATFEIPFSQLAEDLKPPSNVQGDWVNPAAYCKIFNAIQAMIASYVFKIGNITPVGSDQKGIVDAQGNFRRLGTGDPCGFVAQHFGYGDAPITTFSLEYITPVHTKFVGPGENFKLPWKEILKNG